MEISQGNSLCSYLHLTQAKMSDFSFFFFFTKLESRRAEQVLPRVGGLVTEGKGRWQEKWVGG
jgi:hypothetical protein